MNQRKVLRKSQPHTVCLPATQFHNSATRQYEVRTFYAPGFNEGEGQDEENTLNN